MGGWDEGSDCSRVRGACGGPAGVHPTRPPSHLQLCFRRGRWLLQAEDKEGETPLGAAARHGNLRAALAAIAKGEATLDEVLERGV